MFEIGKRTHLDQHDAQSVVPSKNDCKEEEKKKRGSLLQDRRWWQKIEKSPEVESKMENKSRYQKSGKRGKEREKRTFWESKKRSPSPEKMAAPCSRPVSSGRRSSACRPVSVSVLCCPGLSLFGSCLECPLSDATHSRTTQTVGWAQTRKKHTNTQSTKLRRGSDVKGWEEAEEDEGRREKDKKGEEDTQGNELFQKRDGTHPNCLSDDLIFRGQTLNRIVVLFRWVFPLDVAYKVRQGKGSKQADARQGLEGRKTARVRV